MVSDFELQRQYETDTKLPALYKFAMVILIANSVPLVLIAFLITIFDPVFGLPFIVFTIIAISSIWGLYKRDNRFRKLFLGVYGFYALLLLFILSYSGEGSDQLNDFGLWRIMLQILVPLYIFGFNKRVIQLFTNDPVRNPPRNSPRGSKIIRYTDNQCCPQERVLGKKYCSTCGRELAIGTSPDVSVLSTLYE